MQTQELYLPMLIPQWGLFVGIALVIVGFVDKKAIYTYSGWSALIATGLISLYFNLFWIDPSRYVDDAQLKETVNMLMATGWLNSAGSLLAASALLFFHFKKKRYMLMSILTLLFFAILFFQYYSLLQKPK